jgi:uncharacterized membrane protein
VLEVRIPHVPSGAGNRELLRSVLQLLPKLVGFAVSFIVVGSMWIEHHRVFRHIASYDEGLLWRNLFFLLMVAFMPFPTALFSENHSLGAALAIYAGSLGLVGLAKVWVWAYAVSRPHLLAPIAPTLVRRMSRRSWAVPLTCLVTAVLGAAGVPAAYLGFMFIPLTAWLLDRPEAKPSVPEAEPGAEADEH